MMNTTTRSALIASIVLLGLPIESLPHSKATDGRILPMSAAETAVRAKQVGDDIDRHWRTHGEQFVDDAGAVRAWSLYLVEEPARSSATICRVDVVRWRGSDAGEYADRQSTTRKSALQYAAVVDAGSKCERLRYPTDFFHVDSDVDDAGLLAAHRAALRFRHGPYGCREVSSISLDDTRRYNVTARCVPATNWTGAVRMELEVSDGVVTVVANHPVSE